MLVRVPETLSKEKTGSGQTVYVPAYATIFHGDREHQYKLTITLSIRNTDIERPITLMAVDYYDSSGKRLKRYLPGKRLVSPLKALHYVVDESDVSGGPGACFIVQWYSAAPVSPPVVEAVMIGTSGQQGISFISRGVVIGEN
ncbi:MAG: DUF3124 domain-containing protein [Spirochaetes bacterium]|nr:DUF3124 domain-containing protein [Spirochaetota bacterium]